MGKEEINYHVAGCLQLPEAPTGDALGHSLPRSSGRRWPCSSTDVTAIVAVRRDPALSTGGNFPWEELGLAQATMLMLGGIVVIYGQQRVIVRVLRRAGRGTSLHAPPSWRGKGLRRAQQP